jgi:hypothetical protein
LQGQMLVIVVYSITFFGLVVLAPIALWKSAIRLVDALDWRKQLCQSVRQDRAEPPKK